MTGFKVLFLNKYSVIKANEYAKDWNFIELGNIDSGIFSNGMNKNKEDYGIGCLFVNILDVFREFTIDPKKLKRVKASDEEIKQYSLRKGDLILDRSSNILETVGYPSYFDGADDPVVFSGFTFRYRPNSKSWHSKFLTYQLMSHSIRKLVISISTKSANSNVNQKSYKKILIPCPSILEQQKIASILCNVDALIESTQDVVDKSEKLKKGLMQKLLIKGIGHTKFKKMKWMFDKEIVVPENWEYKKIRDFFKLKSGGTPSRTKPEFFKGDVYWVTSGDLNRSKIKDTVEKITDFAISDTRLKLFPKGTFLIASYGLEASKTRGKCGILEMDATCNQACIAFLPSSKILSLFMFYFYLHFGEKIVFSIAQGTKQQNIYSYTLKKVSLFVPPLEEQQKIASILSGVDAYIQKNQEYKKKLERLKKGLMQKLLTGKIRVTV